RDDSNDLIGKAARAGFDLGPGLSRFPTCGGNGDHFENGLLVAVTEKRTREEIDRLVEALKQ
ncbi:MAG: glycine dehydrogenase, partial [Planctomycetes bacterium]|nr:glycine dehydrogenase [Planctomycetota bacterium]